MEDYEEIALSSIKPFKGDLGDKEVQAEIEKMAATLVDIRKPPTLTPRDCDLGQAQPGHAAPPEHLGHARRGILRLLIGIRQAHSAALGTGKRAALILRRLTTCVLPSWEKRARQLVWPHRCWGSASSTSRINTCTAPLSSKCCRLPTRSWPTTRTAPFWPLSRTWSLRSKTASLVRIIPKIC